MRATYARRLRRDLFANPGALCPGYPTWSTARRSRRSVSYRELPEGARIKLGAHELGPIFEGCVGAYEDDAALGMSCAVRRASGIADGARFGGL